jgi:hypothetical protein
MELWPRIAPISLLAPQPKNRQFLSNFYPARFVVRIEIKNPGLIDRDFMSLVVGGRGFEPRTGLPRQSLQEI